MFPFTIPIHHSSFSNAPPFTMKINKIDTPYHADQKSFSTQIKSRPNAQITRLADVLNMSDREATSIKPI